MDGKGERCRGSQPITSNCATREPRPIRRHLHEVAIVIEAAVPGSGFNAHIGRGESARDVAGVCGDPRLGDHIFVPRPIISCIVIVAGVGIAAVERVQLARYPRFNSIVSILGQIFDSPLLNIYYKYVCFSCWSLTQIRHISAVLIPNV
jgi:hypothetical protein